MQVVAAVLGVLGSSEFLVFQKPSGIWEFPGGKVEVGDSSLVEALERELREELNLSELQVGPQLAQLNFPLQPKLANLVSAPSCKKELQAADRFRFSSESPLVAESNKGQIFFYSVLLPECLLSAIKLLEHRAFYVYQPGRHLGRLPWMNFHDCDSEVIEMLLSGQRYEKLVLCKKV